MMTPSTETVQSPQNRQNPPHTGDTAGTATTRDTRGLRRTPFWQAVGVVSGREIRVRLASKAFIITTAIMLGGILLGSLVLPRLSDAFSSTETVAVTTASQSEVAALGDDVEAMPVDSAEAARAAVESGEASAAVVPSGDSPTGLTVIAERDVPTGLVQALSQSPAVELLDPNAPNPMLVYFIALGFGLVFFMAASLFGATIAQSVVEEKQTRIVEILLATVPARAILAGKVIGNSVIALGQVALLAAAALLGMQINEDTLPLDGLGMPILWFVLLFAVGFVMLAALYAAAASLVSRSEDIGSATSPVMMLVMLPYFAVIVFNNNPDILRVMSFIPFSAPVAVPLRVYLGEGALWEHLLSLGILLATTAVVLWLASRVYERSVLRTGKRITWKQALAG